jgi:hypothetical protein
MVAIVPIMVNGQEWSEFSETNGINQGLVEFDFDKLTAKYASLFPDEE